MAQHSWACAQGFSRRSVIPGTRNFTARSPPSKLAGPGGFTHLAKPFMKTNHVRAKLKRGEPSVGTWLTLPDVVAARLMARVGFDWLTVELEHTPVTFDTAANSFAIVSACNVAPLARVPWNT